MPKIRPIRFIEGSPDRGPAHADLPPKKRSSPVDVKIQDVVLPEIHKSAPSRLLASASSPQVIIDLIPEMIPQVLAEGEPSVKKREKRQPFGKYTPIGLRRYDQLSALNALMQVILFLPGFRELFSFAPRSLEAFADFLDQYLSDQLEGKTVSSANADELIRCLSGKLPAGLLFSRKKIDVHALLFLLIQWAFPPLGSLHVEPNSIALHPDWHISWDFSIPFTTLIEQSLFFRPPELFVSVKILDESVSCQLVRRQFFAKSDPDHCYELDAFIEYRPDGSDIGHYIAYLKIDGVWYQCDDERVISMRSTSLNVPLHRSLLLHYKRIDLLQSWR